MTPTPSYCPICGQPSPGGAIHASHLSAPAAPGTSGPAGQTAKKEGSPVAGCLILILLAAGIAYIVNPNKDSSSSPGSNSGGNPAATKHLTGTYIGWDPVDDAHGYAIFSITNSGTTTETATCTISVKDDFGDFGFDSLVGEPVGPGKTIRGRIPISVGKGSFLMNRGEVKDC